MVKRKGLKNGIMAFMVLASIVGGVSTAKAAYNHSNEGSYDYSYGLHSVKKTGTNTYTGTADTKWIKPGSHVTATIVAKNSDKGNVTVPKKAETRTGYVAVSQEVNLNTNGNAKIWSSSHSAINYDTGVAYGGMTRPLDEPVK